jgi:hypothetical protein
VPSVWTAQLWELPAEIELTLPMSLGGVDRWLSLLPQQTGVPSLLIAHVWSTPAEIDRTVPMSLGTSDWCSES